MTRKRTSVPLLGLTAALVLQGCTARQWGAGKLEGKQPDTELPSSFRSATGPEAPEAQAAEPAEESVARVQWREFFTDPQLVQLIDEAIANNKEVQVMLQRVSAARQEIQARRGEYQPFVGLGVEAGGERVGEHTRAGAVEAGLPLPGRGTFPKFLGEFQFGLFSTWEVDVWKKLRNAKKVAVFEYMASQEGKNFLITNLVAEVARSYFELLALDNQLANLEQNIALQRDGLKMVRQLKASARSNTLAVNRYEAEVAKNLARRYAISQEITVVENRLNFLLGRTPRPIERDSEGFMEFEPPALVAGVPAELLGNRPDIRRAELELRASELNVRVARADFLPRVDIRAGVGFEAFSLGHLLRTPESVAASILGGLVAPLVNKRAIRARYKTANARQIQAAYEYEQRIINAFTEVANQLTNLDNLQGSLRHKREQVDLLVGSIDVAMQLFRSARAEYLEVLLVQREALEAESELIETKQKQVVAMVDLYKALGGGWRDAPPAAD